MTANEMDHWFLKQEEPLKSSLLALRSLILRQGPDITAAWRYDRHCGWQ